MLRGFTAQLLPRLPISALQPTTRACRRQMSEVASPICPKFIPLEDGEDTGRSISSGFKFRLVSYNILAQVYVKSSLFPHSPSPCLRWKARSQAIMTVLKSFEADFLCLQELDEFDSFYKRNMESHGYFSVYIQRSGQKRDGCGIFYKPSCAELVLEEKIEYNDLVNFVDYGSTTGEKVNDDVPNAGSPRDIPVGDLPNKNWPDDHGDPNDPCVRLKRDCVGIMAAFKLNSPSRQLVIVVNTHMYWDPDWADVKLAQAEYLLLRVARFKKFVSDKFSCTPCVVVTGDFNSTPGDKVYQCLVSGNTSGTPMPDTGLPISLCSLYASAGGEPPFTNYTPDFTGTLDYIFFLDSGRMKPVSLLQVPGPESPDIVGGLPNYHHPSDHLPVGGEFEVMDT